MAIDLTITQALSAFGISWALWQLIRRFTAKTVLDNIPGPRSASFWTGNVSQFYNRQGWDFQEDVAMNYGPIVKFSGMLGKPIIYVSDPKALHSLVVKDQHVYEELQNTIMTNMVTMGPGLFSTLGEHHRRQRKQLSPVFSINHMRYMLPIFYSVTHQLRSAIATQVAEGPQDIDVLSWLGRTALELIGQGGLGYSFDPLVEDVHNAFGDAVKAFLPSLGNTHVIRMLFHPFFEFGSPLFRRHILDLVPHKGVQRLKEIVDVMWSKSSDIYREKLAALHAGDEAVTQQLSKGKDIISILMKANLEADESDRLPEDEVIGQMVTLIFAGMDTTSNMLARILHLLAQHPDVQEKLRTEIMDACDGRDLSYTELMDIPYLDAIIRETLRVYPPVSFLARVARQDMVLPLSKPIRGRDGKIMHEIPIPNGTDLMVGVLGLNCSKALWGDDALQWKPERWLAQLPSAVTEAHIPGVYSSLMTFMGGSRACIGFKFSELEMKAVLSIVLASFKFELPDSPEPIVWNISGVNFPTMGRGVDGRMLLKVSLLKSSND